MSAFLRIYKQNTNMFQQLLDTNNNIANLLAQQQFGGITAEHNVLHQPLRQEHEGYEAASAEEFAANPARSGEGHPWSLGAEHVVVPGISPVAAGAFRIAPSSHAVPDWSTGGGLHQQPEGGAINQGGLLFGAGNNGTATGTHGADAGHAGGRVPRRRVNDPYAGAPSHALTAVRSRKRSDEETRQQSGGGNLAGLENGEQMGRHHSPDEGILSGSRAAAAVSGNSMGADEDESEAGVQARLLDGGGGGRPESRMDMGAHPANNQESGKRRAADDDDDGGAATIHAVNSHDAISHWAQHQTRGSSNTGGRSAGAAAARSTADLTHREAQGRSSFVSSSNSAVLRRQGEAGADARYAALHEAALADADLLFPIDPEEENINRTKPIRHNHSQHIKDEMEAFIAAIHSQMAPIIGSAGAAAATITKKKKITRIANDEEVLSLPCANTKTGVVDEKKMTTLLNPAGLKQWKEGKAAAFYPDTVCDITPNINAIPATHTYSKRVFAKVIEGDHFETVSEQQQKQHPTKGGGTILFAKESRPNKTTAIMEDRTRMLFWPKLQNQCLKSSSSTYKCVTHMLSSGAYISGVESEAATVGDIKSGFQHIAIPIAARAWFRFVDSEGNLYQMTRLPMGLVPSVQLMEVVTLALIGSPIVCNTAAVFHGVKRDAFVDDFRIHGTTRRVDETITKIKERAQWLNIRIKDVEELETRTAVTFLGVDYNHSNKNVRVNNKTLSKLPQRFETTITAGDLQRVVGRLIFCSAPLAINLGRYYFTMKHTTRICNKINNGVIDEETTISLPAALRNSLQKWRDEVHTTKSYAGHDWKNSNNSPRCILFTDASLFGWGAYLISSDGSVHIVGGAWNDTSIRSGDISWLEGRAVRYAIQAFRGIIMQHKAVDLRIDNTSVVTAMGRGRAKAATVHVEVIEPIEWLRVHGINIYVSYVASTSNLADPISRGIYPQSRAAAV